MVNNARENKHDSLFDKNINYIEKTQNTIIQ